MEKLLFVVMDGVGVGAHDDGDAVFNAYTPTLDRLMAENPNITIQAHGTAVGLPSDDDMGNSEVGHNALGSGQVYAQGAKLVNASIESGAIFESQTWHDLTEQTKHFHSTLHFLGLLSDGNVHSNIAHLKALLSRAKAEGVQRVRIHALLDGRDVPSTSAPQYIDELEQHLMTLNDEVFDGAIASGGGRMKITMDRYEADWAMVERGWQTHVLGQGRMFPDAMTAIETYREETGTDDQNMAPFVIHAKGDPETPIGAVHENDAVVFFNFRGDRALEISRAFEEADFDKFPRELPANVYYAGMLEYDGDLHIPSHYLVQPPNIQHTLTEHLIKEGVTQYAVSETQKFGHVTYFWNGNRTGKFSEELEEYFEVPSDKVDFSERPWMQAGPITDNVLEAMESGKYQFIRVNYPNGDMVGHTGDYRAALVGVESVDLSLDRLYKASRRLGYKMIITADHGNADDMLQKNKDGSTAMKTAHSLNPVPFILIDPDQDRRLKEGNFGLANVAATVSELLGYPADNHWEESLLAD